MRIPLNMRVDAQTKEALYLRYMTETPDKEDKPPARLTVKTVANLMKLKGSDV